MEPGKGPERSEDLRKKKETSRIAAGIHRSFERSVEQMKKACLKNVETMKE